MLVDSVHFWNGKLPEDVAGFTAGTNPGEDGIDTKQVEFVERGRLTVRNSEFHGWRGETVISAAMNLKHNIEAWVEGNEIYGNNVGLRLRGPYSNFDGARVTALNNLLYDHSSPTGPRDGAGAAAALDFLLEELKLWNNTFGADNDLFFAERAGGPGADHDLRNNLFLGEDRFLADLAAIYANDPSNLVVEAADFADPFSYDYRLNPGSSAIDAGTFIAEVDTDLFRTPRPQGSGLDVGAIEFNAVVAPELSTLPLATLALACVGCLARRTRKFRQGASC